MIDKDGELYLNGVKLTSETTFCKETVGHVDLDQAMASVTPPDPWSECVAVDYAKITKAPSEPGRQYVQPAEYYAKLTATCAVLRRRAAAAAAAAVPVGGYSAPGEPLRVKMSKYGTFTISDHLWTVQDSSGSPAEPGRTAPPPDPLDQVIDGWMLRDLLGKDRDQQRHDDCPRRFTPAQRAAVSAHWSAQLRAKVEASLASAAESEPSVRYCEVEPWE